MQSEAQSAADVLFANKDKLTQAGWLARRAALDRGDYATALAGLDEGDGWTYTNDRNEALEAYRKHGSSSRVVYRPEPEDANPKADLLVVVDTEGDGGIVGTYDGTDEDVVLYTRPDGSQGQAPQDCVRVERREDAEADVQGHRLEAVPPEAVPFDLTHWTRSYDALGA